MSAFGPACSAPACALFAPPPPSNAFENFLASASRAGRFLVEVRLFPKDAAPVTYPSLPACGAPACSIADPFGTPAQPIVLTFSDHPVFFSPLDPLRPNLVPEARLASRVDIDGSFSIVPNSASAGQFLTGDVEIFNTDSFLDDYIDDFSVDGQKVRILFGPENGAYSEYRELETVYGVDWQGDEETIRLAVQDLQFRLDQPFSTSAFGGTGGIEGTSALTGQIKPRLIGERFNFTPILIDPANYVYMISNSPIESVDAVLDGGAAFTDSGIDAPTYTALIGASLAEGEYATSLATGLIRIRPAGGFVQSTFSIRAKGDNTGGYIASVGDLILRELRTRAGFDDSDIDAGSFSSLNIYDSGFWYDGQDEELTFRDVIVQMTRQTNGRIIADSRIRAIRIVDPGEATFSYELNQNQIFEVEPEGVLYPPIVETIVRYRPNDAVLSDEQIVGEITPAKQELQKQWATVSQRDGGVLIRNPGAQRQVIIETDLVSEASAVLLASNVSTFWNTDRKVYRIRASREALFFEIGAVVKITHPRYGFAAGRNALIVQRINDYNDQTAELRVLV